jgi:AraC-like DNA-binding protein
LPVSEVAYLLGFSDAANFRRSFKRWTKTTPSALRQEGMMLSAGAMQTSPV